MLIGEKIKSVRQRLGMSQKEFSSTIGYSQPSVANWETGSKQPSLDAVRKIFALAKAKRLSIKMGWLFGT